MNQETCQKLCDALNEGGIKPESEVGVSSRELFEIGDDVRLTPEHYLAVRSDGLTFLSCVEAAAGETELVANVDRLYGTNLMRRQAPIVNMIDDATGKTDDDMQTFLRFVWNCVFIRCAPISSKNAAHLAAADRQTE